MFLVPAISPSHSSYTMRRIQHGMADLGFDRKSLTRAPGAGPGNESGKQNAPKLELEVKHDGCGGRHRHSAQR